MSHRGLLCGSRHRFAFKLSRNPNAFPNVLFPARRVPHRSVNCLAGGRCGIGPPGPAKPPIRSGSGSATREETSGRCAFVPSVNQLGARRRPSLRAKASRIADAVLRTDFTASLKSSTRRKAIPLFVTVCRASSNLPAHPADRQPAELPMPRCVGVDHRGPTNLAFQDSSEAFRGGRNRAPRCSSAVDLSKFSPIRRRGASVFATASCDQLVG
jgi:hypothetical protein